MTDNLRPTRAKATGVANAVLDGTLVTLNSKLVALNPLKFWIDAILLGAEAVRDSYPVETISIIGKICAEINNLDITHMFIKLATLFQGGSYSSTLLCCCLTCYAAAPAVLYYSLLSLPLTFYPLTIGGPHYPPKECHLVLKVERRELVAYGSIVLPCIVTMGK
ncbi:pyruvate kinase-like [Pistacia vera]|uniref:pyruvate kinase-like n=1 Tax=Pistacia vera TaxID=55513 RepID=UPI0012637A51|nr:pyruvate kinase-like [Pistacia vera]